MAADKIKNGKILLLVMVNFCPECGVKVDSNIIFCEKCGCRLEEDYGHEESITVEPIFIRQPNNTCLWVIFICSLLFLILIAI